LESGRPLPFSPPYHALLIHPLPYHDPDRLVWVAEHQRSGVGGAIAEPDMVAWREQRTTA